MMKIIRRNGTTPFRLNAVAIAASILLLSPVLKHYPVFAQALSAGAAAGIAPAWGGVMGSFAGPLQAGAIARFGMNSNAPLFNFAKMDFRSRRGSFMAEPVFRALEASGVTAERFQSAEVKQKHEWVETALQVAIEEQGQRADRLLERVHKAAQEGEDLRTLDSALAEVQTRAVLYLNADLRERVVTANTEVQNRVSEARRQKTTDSIMRNALSLSGSAPSQSINGMAPRGDAFPNPTGWSLKQAWQEWRLRGLENGSLQRYEDYGTLLLRIDATRDENTLWRSVDGMLDLLHTEMDQAEQTWRLRGSARIRRVREFLNSFEGQAEEKKLSIEIREPQHSRYYREYWTKDNDYRVNPHLRDGEYKHMVLIQETGDVAGITALKQRIAKLEAAIAAATLKAPAAQSPGVVSSNHPVFRPSKDVALQMILFQKTPNPFATDAAALERARDAIGSKIFRVVGTLARRNNGGRSLSILKGSRFELEVGELLAYRLGLGSDSPVAEKALARLAAEFSEWADQNSAGLAPAGISRLKDGRLVFQVPGT